MKTGRLHTTVFIIILVFALAAGAVFAVNISVDPLGLCSTDAGVEQSRLVADIMAAGQNAQDISDLVNERVVKRYFVENYLADSGANVIALGSSRAALISSNMLSDDSKLINLSMSGAELREIAALYGLIREQGCIPDKIIVSLDHWWLNDNYSSRRFDMAFADAYDRYATGTLGYVDSGVDPSTVQSGFTSSADVQDTFGSFLKADGETKAEFFSVSYFQQSLKYIFLPFTSVSAAEPSQYYSDATMIRSDGSYCYPADFRYASFVEVENRAAQSLPGSILGSEDYYTLDGEMAALFRNLIQNMIDDGVTVELVMTPVHPLLYSYMQQFPRYDAALGAEQWYRDLAAEMGITIAGSFNAADLGADGYCFYDGYHYREEFVGKLVKSTEEDVQ